MRYTVHEKLVNYETRESRETWTDSAWGEFFGSLFGGENSSKRNGEGGDGWSGEWGEWRGWVRMILTVRTGTRSRRCGCSVGGGD